MRLVMMGTGPFAAPTFRILFDTHHTVVALVTSPLRIVRGKRLDPLSPMRDIAHEHQTPILQPESINTPETRRELAALDADLFVVCDYGQILAADTLAVARLGGINLHSSLLPKYRGAAPINWAIYHGETETGVTVIHMTPQVDAGPCIAQAHILIGPDETAVELENRLSDLGAWLVRRAIDAIEAGRLEVIPQNPALASRAPRLKKSDGEIDWTRPAAAIRNQIRALEPWPKTYTHWHRPDGPPVRVILGPAHASDEVTVGSTGSGWPGTVLEAHGNRLIVACGQGALALTSLQPAGKRMLDVEQFLRGYRVHPGDRFGPDHCEETPPD
jgi:methionyl-tRNA formyltransferase